MKPTKKQLKEMLEVEKKVAEVCDNNEEVVKQEPEVIKFSMDWNKNAKLLHKQFNKQGYSVANKENMFELEQTKFMLWGLFLSDILKKKEFMKCLKRLNNLACKTVIILSKNENEEFTHEETKFTN
jgi:hypothetical protein